MSDNSLLNPVDQSFTKIINDLQTKFASITAAKQPYLEEWYVFPFSFQVGVIQSGAGFRYARILFTNTIPGLPISSFFSIGDKIRVLQNGGSYLYFYVTDIFTSYIEVFGGSNYTLTNSLIIELSKGLINTPTGHPVILKYDPQITTQGGTYIAGPPIGVNYTFSMNGRMVNISANDLSGASITGASYLLTYLPVRAFQLESAFIKLFNNTPTIGLSYVKNALIVGTNPEQRGIYCLNVNEDPLVTGSANHLGIFFYTANSTL